LLPRAYSVYRLVNRWHYDKTRAIPVTCANPLEMFNKRSKTTRYSNNHSSTISEGSDVIPFMDSDDDIKLLQKIHVEYLDLLKQNRASSTGKVH